MMRNFDTILVPVDFSVNTHTALEKALTMISSQGCIHLFHLTPKGCLLKDVLFWLSGQSRKSPPLPKSNLSQNMEELCTLIELKRPGTKVCKWLGFGHPAEEAIIHKSLFLGADLIIIGKNTTHCDIPFLRTIVPSRIAKQTGIAVLTTKMTRFINLPR